VGIIGTWSLMLVCGFELVERARKYDGNVGSCCDGDTRIGTVRGVLCLRWDFEMVRGKCDLDKAEIPASILIRQIKGKF